MNSIFTNINPPCGDDEFKLEITDSELYVNKLIKNTLMRHFTKQHNKNFSLIELILSGRFAVKTILYKQL